MSNKYKLNMQMFSSIASSGIDCSIEWYLDGVLIDETIIGGGYDTSCYDVLAPQVTSVEGKKVTITSNLFNKENYETENNIVSTYEYSKEIDDVTIQENSYSVRVYATSKSGGVLRCQQVM